jgi:hypothetical protein
VELDKRLKRCGCKEIKYIKELGKWYKIELKYYNKYYRFFALTFEEIEKQSLHAMRKVNRKYNFKIMTRGEIKCLVD